MCTINLEQLKPSVQIRICSTLLEPYPTQSGNMYIIGFVDLFSGWPETFAVSNKTAAKIT